MKLIHIIVAFLLVLITIIAGFLSSYTLIIVVFILVFLFNLLSFLTKNMHKRSKYILLIISVFGVVFFFHFGLIVRNNIRKVCHNSIPKNHTESKFNMHPIQLETIEEKITTFNTFTTDTLAKLNFEEKDYYIKKIVSKQKEQTTTKILIVSGIHGSETANVHAILEILRTITSQNLSEKIHFEIIYALNPVGISLFNRFNECNCDINRDFISFKTVQSRLIRDLIEKENFDYVLDLHEGPYDGHYFINNTSYRNLDYNIINTLKKENIQTSPMLENKLKDFLFTYELDNPFTKFGQTMTLDCYLNSLEIENILSESNGLSPNLEERVKGHLIVFNQLIKNIKKL